MAMTIEVEEVAFGRVFRTLDGMAGVVAIRIQGSGPKPARKNGAKSGHGGSTAAQLVLAALAASKAPLDRAALIPAMEAGGKKAASLPDTIQKLRKQKLITSPKVGEYKLTKAGLTAATKGNANGTS
jgi:hypothetical protein